MAGVGATTVLRTVILNPLPRRTALVFFRPVIDVLLSLHISLHLAKSKKNTSLDFPPASHTMEGLCFPGLVGAGVFRQGAVQLNPPIDCAHISGHPCRVSVHRRILIDDVQESVCAGAVVVTPYYPPLSHVTPSTFTRVKGNRHGLTT